MVEVFLLDDVVLGGAWPTDDDGLDVLQFRQPIVARVFRGPLEEIVRRFLNQALETLCGLTTLAVLAHDVGHEVFLHVDALAAGDAVGRLGTVDDEQAVRLLVDQHVLQLREFEGGIAAVAEGQQGLGRVLDDDVHHPRFVVPDDHRTHEDGQAVIASRLETRQGGNGGLDGALHVLSRPFRLDVGRLAVLDLKHRPGVRNVPVRRNDERHQFGAEAPHFAQVFQRHLEAHAAGGQFSVIDHGRPPVHQGPNEDASTLGRGIG